MEYKRKRDQSVAALESVASDCQWFSDNGWTVHTIIPLREVASNLTFAGQEGALIVAYIDEPDLSGVVPR